MTEKLLAAGLKNKRIIITGATATSGKRLAEILIAGGARVGLMGDLGEKGYRTVAELLTTGSEAFYQPCDLSNEDAVERTLPLAVSLLGGLEGLVNIVEISKAKEADYFSSKDFLRQFRMGEMKSIVTTNIAAYRFLKSNGGSIVNILALENFEDVLPEMDEVFSTTKKLKFALWMEASAQRMKSSQVRVNTFVTKLFQSKPAHSSELSDENLSVSDGALELATFLLAPASAPETGKIFRF